MDVDDRDSKAVVETTSNGMVADWQSGGSNFANLLMGMVSDGNSMAVCKGDVVTQSPLISMVDSFAPAPSLWDHPANSQSMGFNSMNNHISTSAFDKLGLTGWEASNSHSISQFPADSAFIERAARFSCFSTGNIADMVNPFGVSQQPVNGYHQAGMMPQDPHVIFGGNSVRATSSGEPRKIEVNPASLSVDHRPQEGSPENKNGGYNEDAKQAGSGTVNSGGGQEETSLKDTGAQPSSTKGLGTKKRKRGVQHAEQSRQPSDEDVKDDGKPLSKKANGENGKQSSQTSDPPKEEYIHMRARRGQATNSHSLAERVRREKISERMKFLQDLVPGCSKVTGKAVMLDEIINYVQSLQRQVEFLSMKLATVSPRLDFNIESLLAKDQMYGARAGPPMGFSADMPVVYSQLHPSQPTVIQPNLPVIHSQLTNISEGYKEPTPQVHSLWDGELHNVVQMGFNSSTSPDIQDANSSLPPDHTKVEL